LMGLLALAFLTLSNRKASSQPAAPLRDSFKDTISAIVLGSEGRTFDLRIPAQRDALSALLKRERAQWRARDQRNYGFVLRVGCFCPGQRGWLLMDVRDNQPLRAWDTKGNAVALTDWNTYDIDGLFDNIERTAERNAIVQIAFDPRWHFPRYVRTSFLPGPDAWSVVDVRGFAGTGTAAVARSSFGIFDAHTDVGQVGRPGFASYDPQRQAYLVAGSGHNMWDSSDEFHFVWKRMSGNFILSTRAFFIGSGTEEHRKIGWTIRPSLETNSAHVTAALHGSGLMSLQFRRTQGGNTEEAQSSAKLPRSGAVIQLERRDGAYIMSVARFGDTLVTQQLADVSLPDTVYVGLFVCAHNDDVVERAAFSNVRITVPAKRDLVPYRDYLGSNLEILDIATGNATIVHQYRGSFQAPNWTPDGKALIYAQEGRLYRFDLASRSASVINTGFATRNNNDHVLSFNGRRMAISHHAVEDSGASVVYTVPATGGTPTRVTAKGVGPSYLHGWSPDGRWLVYTGIRGRELDVYKIPVTGGNEIRLTSASGLDDGPEFTPDGKYVYFNSSRSGRMQIWRMRPDGSEQQQITDDSFNNWFPHISPDGKWIAYIAFPPDIPADDHPFYKHVLLRLMPVGGGPARVIAYVYGGQGTINVPSWSPDGKRLAFVSNSTMP
jgi:TolB protein